MRALGVDPVSDTRVTFRALVNAMARPGRIESVPASPADHAVMATLVDHEVTLHSGDEDLRETLSNAGRYEPAPLEDADVVHVQNPTDGRVAEAKQGTLKEPSDGATAVYRVDELIEASNRDPKNRDAGSRSDDVDGDSSLSDDTVALRVSGPGVPGRRTFQVAGVPAEEIGPIANINEEFPRGVDVVFAAGNRIAALPRSVAVEVV